MSKNKKTNSGGYVFSTDPNFRFEEDEQSAAESLEPSKQKLRVQLDKKQRAGKSVTLITGYVGPDNDLEELGKKLKTFCGTGGFVKEHEIIVQGDNRDKILQWLLKNGYSGTKKIG